MTESVTRQRYDLTSRCLHWIMAALIILAYALILSRSEFAKGSFARNLVVQSHFLTGMAVLVLAFPRWWNRALKRDRHPVPPVTPPLSSVMHKLAFLTHCALYAFLFAQPLLGMLTVWLGRGSIPVPLTDLSIPAFFPVDKVLAGRVKALHETLGTLFYYIIGLHIAAALFHHFVRRDDTLKRMV